jgi:RimJ/RimL family protein N-acetyltransferase
VGDVAVSLIRLRAIRPSDADRLFAWRNDPSVLAQGDPGAPVTREDHDEWLRRVFELDASAPHVLIVCDLDDVIGVVRFDRATDGFMVSITIDERRRNRGVGARALAQATALLRVLYPDPKIIARIKPSNAASIAAFKKAEFREDGRTDQGLLQLVAG